MSVVRSRVVGVLLSSALAVSILSTCGGKGGTDPSPTPTANAPGASTPTPAPTTAPSPLPGMSCGLPAVTKNAENCPRESHGDFLPQVELAARQVQEEYPEYFDELRIKDIGGFRVQMIKNLEAQGLCAAVDRFQLQVKNTNDYSEQYQVEVSKGLGTLRLGPEAYRATCYPATFPVNPQPLLPRGDCPQLPSSTHYGCARIEPMFFETVQEAMEEVIVEKAHLFLDKDRLTEIGNGLEFYNTIVDKMRERGFCAWFDGEELAVKNTNEFNEQYHLLLSSGQVRRQGDSYRATCKPSSF
jgi:hypothetical protein